MAAKHPKALPFLFLSEMWERFGFYLMLGIFTLYLKDASDGMGMEEREASDLYGTFIALIYLTPFVGGLLADRWLGYRKSIIIGGICMGAGYIIMGIHNLAALYVGMTLVILGNGFFKPNISALLGNLYNTEAYKPNKDAGFNLFYMGINIGAFICNFFGAALYHAFGWNWAFFAAGIGMFLGVIVFMLGYGTYADGDVVKPARPGEMGLGKILLATLGPSFAFGILGWLIPGNLLGSDSTDAFIFGAIPVVGFFVMLLLKSEPEERKPLAAMLSIFGVVVIFWAVFKQNGSALTTWADRYTDREIAPAVEPLAETLMLAQVVTAEPDSFPVYDAQFRTTKENGVLVKTQSQHPYLQNLPEEKKPTGDESLKLYATNLYQSVNPFWVILLTPVVVGFFGFLRRRGKEPSTPSKIALGLLISALSALVMVGAVYAGENGAIKASHWWLISSYAVITVGELCLSPMGLSLVSKLSPPRLAAVMMGGWFLSTSIGNKLSGVLSALWDTYEHKDQYFLLNFFLLFGAFLLILLFIRWLNKIFKAYAS